MAGFYFADPVREQILYEEYFTQFTGAPINNRTDTASQKTHTYAQKDARDA